MKNSLKSIIIGITGCFLANVYAQEVRSVETVSPEDLGMRKVSFTANPTAKEVAIFKMEAIQDGEKQIKYTVTYSPQKPAEETILIIDRSFFDPGLNGTYSIKLPSWSFKIERMFLSGSKYGKNGSGEFNFEGFGNKEGKVTTFKFKIFVVTYDEARKLIPDLPEEQLNNSWSWASKVQKQELSTVKVESEPTP